VQLNVRIRALRAHQLEVGKMRRGIGKCAAPLASVRHHSRELETKPRNSENKREERKEKKRKAEG